MKLGLCVKREGASPLWRAQALGATAIRLPLVHWSDDRLYLTTAKAAGLAVVGVLDRDGFSNWADWRADVDRDWERIDGYVRAGLLDALVLGNEWDDGWAGPGMDDDPQVAPRGGASSWVMRFADVAELVTRAAERFGGRLPLILGGMSSGQPAAIDGLDLTHLSAISCLVPDQRVTARAPTAATMRRYHGQVITIETTLGQQVTCTPNHPILTRQGWLPAHAVHKGTQVAQDPQGRSRQPWRANDVQVPTPISEVFRTLSVTQERLTTAGLPLDFHGDGRHGDVDVVGADRLLGHTFSQQRQQRGFMPSLSRHGALASLGHRSTQALALTVSGESRSLSLSSSPYRQSVSLEQPIDSSRLLGERQGDGIARLARLIPSVQRLDVGVGMIERAGLAAVADVQAAIPEGLYDHRGAASDASPERLERLPTEVTFVEVSDVRVAEFDGHVYNLSTEDGRIVADGIITHNCHPYGKAPAEDWPAPGWGTGYIGWLLDPLRAKLDERGLTASCRIVVGEMGINAYQNEPGLSADWYTRSLSYYQQRGDVDAVFVFCDSDSNVDGYGVFRLDDSPTPSVAAISAVAARLPSNAPLLEIAPAPEPGPVEPPVAPPDTLPWFDTDFDVAAIVAAMAAARPGLDLGTTIASVSLYWPEFGPYLAEAGLDADRAAKIAMLATIAVETGGTFTPLDEYGSDDYFNANYGPGTSAGQSLGNVYAGDGARFHGRGFVQLTGRANYATYSQLLGIDLVSDPDEAKDPTAAAGVLVSYFVRGNIPAAAERGNWELVRRAVNGGLNGYDTFLRAVQSLVGAVAPAPTPTHADLVRRLAAVYADGLRYVGTPYVWGGFSPAGFDCSGFVAYAYAETLAVQLAHFTDAIADQTDPVASSEAVPGDLVLYAYYDPNQPGVAYPHIGLVAADPGLVLDARGGVGVGLHAHVTGAVRHYRRVRGLGATPPPPGPQEDPEDAMWRDKFVNTIAYIGDDVADALEVQRAGLDDYGPPPSPPSGKKATKAQWQAYAQALAAWSQLVAANTDLRYHEIGLIGQTLRDLRTTEVGPRPG